MAPSTNGPNGRDGRGRFAKGNSGGPGNPHARRVQPLRGALLQAVSADDVRAIVLKLVERAKAGDLDATRELLDRVLGKSAPRDLELEARLEAAEAALETMEKA